MPPLWRQSQRTTNPKLKYFFSIWTKRLAESVDGFNSSLTQWSGGLWRFKACSKRWPPRDGDEGVSWETFPRSFLCNKTAEVLSPAQSGTRLRFWLQSYHHRSGCTNHCHRLAWTWKRVSHRCMYFRYVWTRRGASEIRVCFVLP